MAQKTLLIISANGDERWVSVLDTTMVREILQQYYEDDDQDRQATLLRGVTLLEPDMTVSEAGLEDRDEISLLWADPFVEMERWTGEEMDENLYVRIPPHVTSIADFAFNMCKAPVKIQISDSVTRIGDLAFFNCSSLTEVVIPDSMSSIGHRAFACCSSLSEVNIPSSVTSFGVGTFAHCSSLTRIKIPDSVTIIEPETFANCTSLTEVEIPDSVTSIGREAFSGCTALRQVTIPESVTSIGDRAFQGCSSLTEVEIPDSVSDYAGCIMGTDVFAGCTCLASADKRLAQCTCFLDVFLLKFLWTTWHSFVFFHNLECSYLTY